METLKKRQLMKEKAEFLEAAKSLGVFDAFNKAVDTASIGMSGGPPNDRDEYFLKWFTKAAKQNAPGFALRQCLNGKNAGGELQLWGWMNVSVILQNGLFKVFVPRKLLHGENVEKLSVEKGEIKREKVIDLPQWVRTKYGYVERSGEFANEMRKHSIGGFSL